MAFYGAMKKKPGRRKAVIDRFIRKYGASAGDRAAHIYAHTGNIRGKEPARRHSLARQIAMHTATGGKAYKIHIPGQQTRGKWAAEERAKRAKLRGLPGPEANRPGSKQQRSKAAKLGHGRKTAYGSKSASVKKAWATRKKKYGGSGRGKRGSLLSKKGKRAR
jgi:hypothetical protein